MPILLVLATVPILVLHTAELASNFTADCSVISYYLQSQTSPVVASATYFDQTN